MAWPTNSRNSGRTYAAKCFARTIPSSSGHSVAPCIRASPPLPLLTRHTSLGDGSCEMNRSMQHDLSRWSDNVSPRDVLREFMPDLGQYLAKGKVRKQRKSCRRPHLRRQARSRTSEYLRHYVGNKIAIRHEGFADPILVGSRLLGLITPGHALQGSVRH